MSADLSIHLSSQAFAGLQQAAIASGRTPVEVAAATLEQVYSVQNGEIAEGFSELREVRKIEDHFGSIDMGEPIGLDNAQIDADLARAYGNVVDDV